MPAGRWLDFDRDLYPGQGGTDVTGEQQAQAADLRLEILFHAVFEPFIENVRDAETVEVAHELFVGSLTRRPRACAST